MQNLAHKQSCQRITVAIWKLLKIIVKTTKNRLQTYEYKNGQEHAIIKGICGRMHNRQPFPAVPRNRGLRPQIAEDTGAVCGEH
jgi:hypothetical protein